jgi:hypothetical protein
MVKAGAFQYLIKPFETKDLLRAVEEALERSEPQRTQARLRRESPATPARIIGASRPMREMFDLIERAARSASTVLITGESGTGKELVALAIHDMSGRKGAFVPVNCAAIPAELIESELFGHTGTAFTGAKQARAGLFEAADGGAIFLDEIGDLPRLHLGVRPSQSNFQCRDCGYQINADLNGAKSIAKRHDLVEMGRYFCEYPWKEVNRPGAVRPSLKRRQARNLKLQAPSTARPRA